MDHIELKDHDGDNFVIRVEDIQYLGIDDDKSTFIIAFGNKMKLYKKTKYDQIRDQILQ